MPSALVSKVPRLGLAYFNILIVVCFVRGSFLIFVLFPSLVVVVVVVFYLCSRCVRAYMSLQVVARVRRIDSRRCISLKHDH